MLHAARYTSVQIEFPKRRNFEVMRFTWYSAQFHIKLVKTDVKNLM